MANLTDHHLDRKSSTRYAGDIKCSIGASPNTERSGASPSVRAGNSPPKPLTGEFYHPNLSLRRIPSRLERERVGEYKYFIPTHPAIGLLGVTLCRTIHNMLFIVFPLFFTSVAALGGWPLRSMGCPPGLTTCSRNSSCCPVAMECVYMRGGDSVCCPPG